MRTGLHRALGGKRRDTGRRNCNQTSVPSTWGQLLPERLGGVGLRSWRDTGRGRRGEGNGTGGKSTHPLGKSVPSRQGCFLPHPGYCLGVPKPEPPCSPPLSSSPSIFLPLMILRGDDSIGRSLNNGPSLALGNILECEVMTPKEK